MKAILRSINNFSCKLKQSNNQKYNIVPRISNNKLKSISGNGNITIEDAIKKDLKDYRVYGKTYQNSTSGKNLYNQIINKKQYGLTIVGDKYKIAINGEQTSTEQKIELGSATLPPGTYTIMIEDLNGMSNLSGWIYIKDTWNRPTSTGLYVNSTTSKRSVTFTLTQANTITYGMYLVTYRPTYNSLIRLSLVSGSTEDYDFEPYTGGQPSPNPDYPQEIVSCGDKTKNLYNKNDNNIINNKYLNVDGTFSDSNNFKITTYIPVKENTVYSLIPYRNYGACVCFYSEDKTFISGISIKNIQNTLTTPENAKFIRLSVRKEGHDDVLMLVEGSIFSTYEPYGYKIPINIKSKNLVNNTLQSQIKNGITLTKNLDGSFTVNGTATANTYFDVGNFTQKKGIAYTLNGCPKGGGNSKYRLYILGETAPYFDNGDGVDFPIINIDTQRTLRLAIYNNMTVDNLIFYPMVRLTEISDCQYQPYYNETTNIYLDEPLRKIGNNCDDIDFINQKVIRRLGMNTLNSNNISLRSNYTNIEYAQFPKALDFVGYNKYGNYSMFCSHAIYSANPSNWDSNVNVNKLYTDAATTQWWIGFKKDTGLDTIKQMLDGCIIIYPLLTPTEEDIELPNIKLIEGKNIITIGTEVQGVFEAEYYSKEIIDISDYKYNLRKVED